MRLRSGEIFIDTFCSLLLQSLFVKEFWKFICIFSKDTDRWHGTFFWNTDCTRTIVYWLIEFDCIEVPLASSRKDVPATQASTNVVSSADTSSNNDVDPSASAFASVGFRQHHPLFQRLSALHRVERFVFYSQLVSQP